MSEKRKPPVRINLGGKTLIEIERAFVDLGWKKNLDALIGINLDTPMMLGDKNLAEFWHISRSGFEKDGHTYHKDILMDQENSLVRICPIDGREIVLSNG